MDGEIKTKKLNKGRILAKTKEMGKVPRVVFGRVDSGEFAETVDITVDAGSNIGELGNKIHRILEGGAPIIFLAHAVLIGLGKGRAMVELKKGG